MLGGKRPSNSIYNLYAGGGRRKKKQVLQQQFLWEVSEMPATGKSTHRKDFNEADCYPTLRDREGRGSGAKKSN